MRTVRYSSLTSWASRTAFVHLDITLCGLRRCSSEINETNPNAQAAESVLISCSAAQSE